MKTYSETEAKPLLESLKNWEFKNNAIECNFKFKKKITQTMSYNPKLLVLYVDK